MRLNTKAEHTLTVLQQSDLFNLDASRQIDAALDTIVHKLTVMQYADFRLCCIIHGTHNTYHT